MSSLSFYRIHIGLFILAASGAVAAVLPGLTFEDGSELCLAGKTLGVAHPPGFPLWVLWAKVACMVPLGQVPFRVNLLSGVFFSLACACIPFSLLRGRLRSPRHWPDCLGLMAAGLALMGSARFWGQALSCEVYAMEMAFLSCALGACLLGHCRMSLLGLLVGLSLCVHLPLTLFTCPVMMAIFLLRQGLPRPKHLVRCAALMGVGLLPWLAIPIRSGGRSAVAWRDASDLPAFWEHVTRGGYPLERSLAQLGNYWPQLQVGLEDLAHSFGPIVLVLAGIGLLFSWRRTGGLLVGWTFLIVPLALSFLMQGSADHWELMANRIFFLPGALGVALCVGEGVTRLAHFKRWPPWLTCLFVAILLALQGAKTWAGSWGRSAWAGEDWATLLRSVRQDRGILLAANDSLDFLMGFVSSESEAPPGSSSLHRLAWGDPVYMAQLHLSPGVSPTAFSWVLQQGQQVRPVWEYHSEDPIPEDKGHGPLFSPLGPLGTLATDQGFSFSGWPLPWEEIVLDEAGRKMMANLYFSRGFERHRHRLKGAVEDYLRCLLLEPDHFYAVLNLQNFLKGSDASDDNPGGTF